MQEMWVLSLGQEDPLEEEMITFSSILAWEIPWTVALQAPLSLGFSRQEYWNGLLFPFPRDLPEPGIKPRCPVLAGGFFITSVEAPLTPYVDLIV